MITKQTRLTRNCDGPTCINGLTIYDDQPLTESIAIQLGMWLTVSSELVTPEGVKVSAKTFCSLDCLKQHIDAAVAEYSAAESRVLTQPSGLILTDGE